IPDAICGSSIHLAKNTNASAIAVMTSSGYTAFEISSYRPNADIYVFTGNKKLINLLSLVWGVRVFVYSKFESTDGTIQDVNGLLKELNLVYPGQIVINTAATPLHQKGKTNTIRVAQRDEVRVTTYRQKSVGQNLRFFRAPSCIKAITSVILT